MDPDPQTLRETVAELANLVIGNAVTTLNDAGFRFKVHPPVEHPAASGFRGSEDIGGSGHGFFFPRRQRLHEHRHPLQSPPPRRPRSRLRQFHRGCAWPMPVNVFEQ